MAYTKLIYRLIKPQMGARKSSFIGLTIARKKISFGGTCVASLERKFGFPVSFGVAWSFAQGGFAHTFLS